MGRYSISITPKPHWFHLNIQELWLYRELFFMFTWRDIKVRYKQTSLGIAWAILQPLLFMVVFTLFFGRFKEISESSVPYPLFVYTGLILWNFFSVALSGASGSLIENENIIKKVYFPRLIIPVSATLSALVDLLIASVILVGLMFWYHVTPSLLGALLFPLFILLTFITAVGGGLLLSAINIKYRDVRYILPFFIQILMFLTPVIYPLSVAAKKYHILLSLNPMTGIIENARRLLLNTGEMDTQLLFTAIGVSILTLLIGTAYFRATERFFADVA